MTDIISAFRDLKWEDSYLARLLESGYPKLMTNFKLLPLIKQEEFLSESRKDLNKIENSLRLLGVKYEEFFFMLNPENGQKRVNLDIKAPKEWLLDASDIIDKLWVEKDLNEDLIEYLTWVHQVSIILSLGYYQYCDELESNRMNSLSLSED